MMPYYNITRAIYLATIGITVTDTAVTLSFPNHAFLHSPYRGILYVNIQQSLPSDTTSTLPIVFETNGITLKATILGEEEMTAADITGTGIYEFWYDKQTNTLQLI